MKLVDSQIEIPSIVEAEKLANETHKSDDQLAREYAEMMEEIYLSSEALNLNSCPPDRRLFRGDKEAWVYEHGNIAELVFVK